MSNMPVSVFTVQSTIAYHQDRLEKEAVKERTAQAELAWIRAWQARLEPDVRDRLLLAGKPLSTHRRSSEGKCKRKKLKQFLGLGRKKQDSDVGDVDYGGVVGNPVGMPKEMSEVGDEELTALPQLPGRGAMRSDTMATLRPSEEAAATEKAGEMMKPKKLIRFRKSQE